MNIWRWAAFFVVVLGFEYATATLPFLTKGRHFGVQKPDIQYGNGRSDGWSSDCHCNDDVTRLLDGHILRIKASLGAKMKLPDYPFGKYKFTGGMLQSFNNFHIERYRCSLTKNYVRIFSKINFSEFVFRYGVSRFRGTFSLGLGFSFGGLGSLIDEFIGGVIGGIASLFLKVAVPDVRCTVVLKLKLGVRIRGGLEVENVIFQDIDNFSLLGGGFFSNHRARCESYVRTMINVVLRDQCQSKLKDHFESHFKKVTFTLKKEMFSSSHSSSGYEHGRQNKSDNYDDSDTRRGRADNDDYDERSKNYDNGSRRGRLDNDDDYKQRSKNDDNGSRRGRSDNDNNNKRSQNYNNRQDNNSGRKGESDSSIGDNGSSSGSLSNQRVTKTINNLITKIQTLQLDDTIGVPDYPVGGYKFSGGKLKNFNKFRMDKCSFLLKENFVKIFVRLSFPKLSLHYGVSKMKSPLGGLGSILHKLIKNVTNFVLDLVFRNVYVTVVLRFDSEVGLVVQDIIVPTNIYFTLLGSILSKHRDTCEPYIRKMLIDTFRYQCQTTLRSSFKSECSKVTIEESIFYEDGATREYNGSKGQSVSGRNSGGTSVSDDDDSDNEDNKSYRNRAKENESYSDDGTDGSENGDGSDKRQINDTDGGSETQSSWSSKYSTKNSSSDNDDGYDDNGGDEDDDEGGDEDDDEGGDEDDDEDDGSYD